MFHVKHAGVLLDVEHQQFLCQIVLLHIFINLLP